MKLGIKDMPLEAFVLSDFKLQTFVVGVILTQDSVML